MAQNIFLYITIAQIVMKPIVVVEHLGSLWLPLFYSIHNQHLVLYRHTLFYIIHFGVISHLYLVFQSYIFSQIS
jgi:hypothetical protein